MLTSWRNSRRLGQTGFQRYMRVLVLLHVRASGGGAWDEMLRSSQHLKTFRYESLVLTHLFTCILQNKIGIFGSTLFWAFGLSLAMKLPPSKRFVPLVLWAFSGLVYYFDEWYGKTLQELSDNHGQRGIGVYVHSAFCLFQLSVIYLARESSSPTAAKEKSN